MGSYSRYIGFIDILYRLRHSRGPDESSDN